MHSKRILRKITLFNILLILLVAFLIACQSPESDPSVFENIPGKKAGLTFNNRITESDSLNAYIYYSMYNGGGVGAGDINNDGLPDLFFCGNLVSSRLFLNKGNLKFEDITQSAGVSTNRWCRGVSMVDINSDGFLDIYVTAADRHYSEKGRNLLFINNGDETFTESAAIYGIDDISYSTLGAFFDYDRDGDLDLFLLNNGMEGYSPDWPRPIKLDGSGISNDRFYRNNGDNTFTDITREAGILAEGYGLGISVADINRDGWPDVYCSNDFISNDLLYINNKDGTFTESLSQYFDHTSYNGMGMDIADINNDALTDIFVLDMRPETNRHLKTMVRGTNRDRIEKMIFFDYMPQFVRNTLQLNMGEGHFSEIGRLAGVYTTDWSWSALFADYDNDGYRDLFITTGYGRDVTDLDYIDYFDRNYEFGSSGSLDHDRFDMLMGLPGIEVHNYFYKNTRHLKFEDVSSVWAKKKNSFSNGAVFSDLDLDGDLDIVTNNINNYPFLYKNLASENDPEWNNWLQVRLRGKTGNPGAIGSKIMLYYGDQIQFYEHFLTRGYKSSIDPLIHFGLGDHNRIDSLEITWPCGDKQLLKNIRSKQRLEIIQKETHSAESVSSDPDFFSRHREPLFSKLSGSGIPEYLHQENLFQDSRIQPLLPQFLSREGPGLGVVDVDNNGLEDFYIGGAYQSDGKLFLQQSPGHFTMSHLDPNSVYYEELGVLFFDADSDGDPDIYITSGGNHMPLGMSRDTLYRDRLLLNDGDGKFQYKPDIMPQNKISGSCVSASDFDKDGDIDLFVGGRIVPFQYPMSAQSMLLENENGIFKEATEKLIPAIKNMGLVKSALWSDFDNDGWIDLIIAGDWMPLRFFRNEKGNFSEITELTGIAKYTGFWNSLAAGDFDRDGDMDYIAGNWGENTHLKASLTEPLEIIAKDFDNNGIVDPIIGFHLQGKQYPAHGKDALIEQIKSWDRKFPSYTAYAKSSYYDIFNEEELEGAYNAKVTHTKTSFIENLGNGRFKISAFPVNAQMAPVYGISVEDYNRDGYLDVLMVGNRRSTELEVGYIDASKGQLFLGNGTGNFQYIPNRKNGFWADGEARSLVSINAGDQIMVLVANNSSNLEVYTTSSLPRIKYDPDNNDASALIYYENGNIQKHEFNYGSGYLSSSSRKLYLTGNVARLEVIDYLGNKKSIPTNDIR